MDLQGKLRNPELAGCSVPLTVIIDGKKERIGLAYVSESGYVSATVDLFRNPLGDKIKEFIETRTDMSFSVRMNPEVRLEPRKPGFPA
jgi:hypothetical protein